MSAVKRRWASVQLPWSNNETAAEFGEVVQAAANSLNRYEDSGFGADFWSEVVQLGWHAAFVDEQFDGLGLDGAAMAEIVAPLAVSGWSHAYLGPAVESVALLQAARSQEGDRLLRLIATGELRLQPAIAESAESPQPAEVATCASRGAGGWVISGRKPLVPYAESAQGFLVLAAEEGNGARSLFYVPADAAGVACTAADSAGVALADVVFDGVTVSTEALLATGEVLDAALARLLDLSVALDAVALASIGYEALALTLQYTSERIVFDKPLDTLQAVQQHCATTFLRLLQMQVLACDALQSRTDSVERAWTSSMAKVKASEGIIEVVRTAHRVHGGIGFYDDYPLADHTRRAVAIQGLRGSVSWHRQRLQSLVTNPDHALQRTVLRSGDSGSSL